MAENSPSPGLTWLLFALLTVISWGVYGVFLHTGQTSMTPGDPVGARYRAFLFVGIAYFLTAVLAPLALLMLQGGAFRGYTAKGMTWSLIAGIVGAIGAFGVLLAFGAAPKPTARYVPVVMSIIFAGAPIVNAIVSMLQHPPSGGLSAIKWQFYLGILCAALGGCLVSLYKPGPSAPILPAAAKVEPARSPQGH